MKLRKCGIGFFTDNLFDVFKFKLFEKASKFGALFQGLDITRKITRPSQTILALKNAGVRI